MIYPKTDIEYDLEAVDDKEMMYWIDDIKEDHLLYSIDENNVGHYIPSNYKDGDHIFVAHREYIKPGEKKDIKSFYTYDPRL